MEAANREMLNDVWGREEILIEDTIQTAPHFKFQDLRERGFFSTVYMASSKYFRKQDFAQSWKTDDLSNQFFGNILKRSKQFLKL